MEAAVDECLWCEFDYEFYCEEAADERDDGEPMPCAKHADPMFVHHVAKDRWRLSDSPGPPGTRASWHYKKVFIEGRRASVQVFPSGLERRGSKYYWLFETKRDASQIKSLDDYGKPVTFSELPTDRWPEGVPCSYDPKTNKIAPRPLAVRKKSPVDDQRLSCCAIQMSLEEGDVSQEALEHMRRQLHVVKRCPRGRDCDILREVIYGSKPSLAAWCHVFAFRHPVASLGHYGYGEEALVWPCLRCHRYNQRSLERCSRCMFPRTHALHSAEAPRPAPLDMNPLLRALPTPSDVRAPAERKGSLSDDEYSTSEEDTQKKPELTSMSSIDSDSLLGGVNPFKGTKPTQRPQTPRTKSIAAVPGSFANASAPELLRHMHPPLSRDTPSLQVIASNSAASPALSTSSNGTAATNESTPKTVGSACTPDAPARKSTSRSRSSTVGSKSSAGKSKQPPSLGRLIQGSADRRQGGMSYEQFLMSKKTEAAKKDDGYSSGEDEPSDNEVRLAPPNPSRSDSSPAPTTSGAAGLTSPPPHMRAKSAAAPGIRASFRRGYEQSPLASSDPDLLSKQPTEIGETGGPDEITRESSLSQTLSQTSHATPRAQHYNDILDFIAATHVSENEQAEFLSGATTSGISVFKHGRSGRPRKRKIYIDLKKNALVYGAGRASAGKRIYFASMVKVVQGKRTAVFQRDTAAGVDESLCMSIELDSEDRASVDLQFPDTDSRDSWAKHMRRIVIARNG